MVFSFQKTHPAPAARLKTAFAEVVLVYGYTIERQGFFEARLLTYSISMLFSGGLYKERTMSVLTSLSGALLGIIGLILFALSWFASSVHHKAREKKSSVGCFIIVCGGMGFGLMVAAYFILI